MNYLRTFVLAAVILLGASLAQAAETDPLGARLTKTPDGLKIEDVAVNGLASQLELKPGDVIQKLNGEAVAGGAELRKAIDGRRELTFQWVRSGQPETVRCLLYWPQAQKTDQKPRGPVVIKKAVIPN
jgi:S1-C subfamily serine protease